ncbi:MAG: InlB B-repeat-containing protein, partial [Methanomassiliicoccaceae archaeon]|nr:InlB B-repeat-containing protein [Methanomassiliicoccaceae archaeon]
VWASSVKDGGTQSAPMILNNRLYIGGGGSTMGTAEPFTVINIAGDGTMSLAYRADSLKTKGTASITTAYATANNGYAVYIYLIEYGKVLPGEDSDSPIGTADIFVLRDSVGQTNADIVFRLTPSVPQFAYQSFTVSPEGYLLVRNDSTLFCYGPRTPVGYTHSDVENAIDLALSFASKGSANSAQVKKIEERYAALNTSDKSKVSNYDRLQDLYCNVTFVIGSERVTEKAVKGSIISAPNAEVPNGKTLVGWGTGSGTWKFATDKANGDLTLTAILEDAATVSFNSAGGSSVNSISVKKGSVMGYVKDPERSGYTFGGWFSGNTRYTPQYSVVSSSITLTAKWLKNSMMSFDTDGGSSAGAINVTYSKAVGTLPMISKSGYRFEGWYYNETKYTESTIYSYESGITLKAKWSQNTSTVLNNGKGMTVTGTMPDSASINIRVPYTGPGSLTEPIKAAAGNSDMDFVMITISGDGIDKSQGFEMSVPVGSGNNGKTIDVYYYLDSGVKKASVTVSGGVLKVTLYGESGGGGVQIIFGLAKGTGIMSHV